MSSKTRSLKDKMARSLARRSWNEALDAGLKLREASPGDERVLLRLGEVYERLGRKKDAVSVFKEVVDLYAEDGRLARAISVAKRIAALDPKDESVGKKLALLYSARGLPVAPRSLFPREEPAPAKSSPSSRVEDVEPSRTRPETGPSRAPKQPADIPLEEEHFTESEEERLRRRLGSAELESIDIDDLDLALVELDVVEAPACPPSPLFSDLAPEELHEVMKLLLSRRFEHGEAVVRQGDEGDSVFLICDGQARVRVRRPDGIDVEVAVLGEGTFFGEFGVFTDGRRHATVVAEGTMEVLEMRQRDLEEVVRRHPRVRDVLRRYYRERTVETGLAVSKLFGRIDRESRLGVAKVVSQERHAAGSIVMQEGEEASGLYLVRRGTLVVRTDGFSGESVDLADLGPGDFFGEVSALSGAPVTADVVAEKPSDLIKISRERLLELCERWPDLRLALEKARDRRINETIERLGAEGTI